MIHNRLITENQLDDWVRGNTREAQALIPELIYRLVAASSPNPAERRFPLGDSIGQHGPDGILLTDNGFPPFVPNGRSIWEIGTSLDARQKANSDYKDLVESIPEEVRKTSTFVFVTPLSARRDWPHTWKKEAQADWLKERRGRGDWQEILLLDGTNLIDWMLHFPAVERWLAKQMRIPADEILTPDIHWSDLSGIGEPPPLPPEIFTLNREQAVQKLNELLTGNTLQLKLDTHYSDQIADFVSAHIQALPGDEQFEALGRCLIISGRDAWDAIVALDSSHVLIAGFELDDEDRSGTMMLQKARRAGHAVIYGGPPGGIPHPNRANLPNPKTYQLQEALVKGGYKEERARTLAQKSGGNLGSLLRCLQNLSLAPEWAQSTEAAELVIAQLLGAWNERITGDKDVVEAISGKPYGEWIASIRNIVLRPGTPLTQRDGSWKFISRYEGWYALGSHIFDEHLERLKAVAIAVLSERNPEFDLPPDERYAASIHGKVLSHSSRLRKGLAETLALLGNHSTALNNCSQGKPELIARLSVREIFTDARWEKWASLNDVLPLLAEAAPSEFLDAAESALKTKPCLFEDIYGQERAGISGRNYLTGLLWSLETLAWDARLITRVALVLGELASIDPGGNWGNRPSNSLASILLPWFPQTCAPIPKRKIAVAALAEENPDVAWTLLLALLPQSHQTTSGTRKPAWRETIPQDWTDGVTHQEYWEQISSYAEIVIDYAKRDREKLIALIDRLDDLPQPALDQILDYLGSDEVTSLDQDLRLGIWTELTRFAAKHRKFADADWALPAEFIGKIEKISQTLSPMTPFLKHQRLFSDRDYDLYEEKGNFEEQRKRLESKRLEAITEIFNVGGISDVFRFAQNIKSPWRAGIAFGSIAPPDVDNEILPAYLESEDKSLSQFAGGFVWGRYWENHFEWVDSVSFAGWKSSSIGLFFTYLPFDSKTWDRVARSLEEESEYWSKTSANPYEATGTLEVAIEKLIQYKRGHAAIRCFEKSLQDKQDLPTQLAIRALDAAVQESTDPNSMDAHSIVEVIKALQDNPETNQDDLFSIEWRYLRLLDRYSGASPRLLETRLATDPSFFCEIIRIIYRSDKEDHEQEEPSEHQQKIAQQAYHLLKNWEKVPGIQGDGTVNEEELFSWLEEVKKQSRETGHLRVSLVNVGHVLMHSPKDPDGLLLPHPVAKVLNGKDENDMREGLKTKVFNSRGVHSFTSGRAELELSNKNLAYAEDFENSGYHRLAVTFREIAESYRRDAEYQAKRDPFED